MKFCRVTKTIHPTLNNLSQNKCHQTKLVKAIYTFDHINSFYLFLFSLIKISFFSFEVQPVEL